MKLAGEPGRIMLIQTELKAHHTGVFTEAWDPNPGSRVSVVTVCLQKAVRSTLIARGKKMNEGRVNDEVAFHVPVIQFEMCCES
jgi:hypothetical protein